MRKNLASKKQILTLVFGLMLLLLQACGPQESFVEDNYTVVLSAEQNTQYFSADSTPYPQTLTIRVTDSYGDPIPNVAVSFNQITSAPIQIIDAQTASNSNGYASAIVTASEEITTTVAIEVFVDGTELSEVFFLVPAE